MRSTIVGKLTLALGDKNASTLVEPDPLVLFDRIAPNGRHVTEACEVAPFTGAASVVAYGGPLRFTLEDDTGRPKLVVSASAKSPAGYSITSEERSALAPERPTRGVDGLLTIPEGIDGRYFVTAPRIHQLPAIRGDERFLLELPGYRAELRLPATSIVVTLEVAGVQRAVVLTPDMICVHGGARRVALVARAVVFGDALLLAHAPVPTAGLNATDFGDYAPLPVDETRDISGAELDSMRGPSQPFGVDSAARASQRSGTTVPATPFDAGFAPAAVVSAEGVVATLTANEDNAQQLKSLRDQLRAESAPKPAVSAPDPKEPSPRPEAPPARVAPPKPGAMAKPRFKPR